MASQKPAFVLWFAAISALTAAAATTTHAFDSNKYLKQICGVTSDSSFCLRKLGSHPRIRAHGADLQGLGVISVELEIKEATASLTKMKRASQALRDHDPAAKSLFNECRADYSAMLPDLRAALKGASVKAYRDMLVGVRDATNAIYACVHAVRRKDQRAAKAQLLNYINDNQLKISEILIIINDMLIRQSQEYIS